MIGELESALLTRDLQLSVTPLEQCLALLFLGGAGRHSHQGRKTADETKHALFYPTAGVDASRTNLRPSTPSFEMPSLPWQNFYILTGTAGATLVGLMFVAVTFGSNLVTEESANSARAFLDPIFTHFVQVLLTSCLVLIPTMPPTLLGTLLLLVSAVRMVGLFSIYRRMREAQRVHHDIELSDWLMGVAIPFACHLALGATGAAFLLGSALAFNLLAAVTVLILLVAAFGAWELLVWLAMARNRAQRP
jgi:hypothetical protein